MHRFVASKSEVMQMTDYVPVRGQELQFSIRSSRVRPPAVARSRWDELILRCL